MGLIAFQQKQFDKAIDHFHTAIRINPNLADAHFNLALALHRLNRNAEALPEIERALEMNPHDETGQQLKVKIQRTLGMGTL